MVGSPAAPSTNSDPPSPQGGSNGGSNGGHNLGSKKNVPTALMGGQLGGGSICLKDQLTRHQQQDPTPTPILTANTNTNPNAQHHHQNPTPKTHTTHKHQTPRINLPRCFCHQSVCPEHARNDSSKLYNVRNKRWSFLYW